jgi:membrane carboxypeptidase/penicillin-binding protein PbpC
LTIVQPRDGARYVIDPERATELQVLAVTVVAPSTVRQVMLEVDGAIVEHADRAATLHWTLQSGDHQLVALDEHGHRSTSVRVQVRNSNE